MIQPVVLWTIAIACFAAAIARQAATVADPAAASAILAMSAFAALLSTACAAPLAIAIDRLRFPARRLAYTVVVLATATPPSLLGGEASQPAAGFASALASGIPLAFWTFYLALRLLPDAAESAARIDGASPARLLAQAIRQPAAAALLLVFALG